MAPVHPGDAGTSTFGGPLGRKNSRISFLSSLEERPDGRNIAQLVISVTIQRSSSNFFMTKPLVFVLVKMMLMISVLKAQV